MSLRTELTAVATAKAENDHPYTRRLMKMDKALARELAAIERRLKARKKGGLSAFFANLGGASALTGDLVCTLAAGEELCSLPTNYTTGLLGPAFRGSDNHQKEIREATDYVRTAKLREASEALKTLPAWRDLNARCADPAVDMAVDIVFNAVNFNVETEVLTWKLDVVVRVQSPYQQSFHAAHFGKKPTAAETPAP